LGFSYFPAICKVLQGISIMTNNIIRWSLIGCLVLPYVATAQKPITIKLDNPSFEDFPQAGHTPQGWFDCGFAEETPPDVQPSGNFQVIKSAAHGSTYLGLVVRDNNTWESVGQRLKSPLLKGVKYSFSLMLARSELYVSQSRLTNRECNYITPVIIRIWGGSSYCSKEEMLAESDGVASASFKQTAFKLMPKSNYNYLTIEAFYKPPTLFPYNGNVLIDNASDIVPIIEKQPAVVAQVTPTKPKPTIPKPASSKTAEPTKPIQPTVADVQKGKADTPRAKTTPTPEPPKEKTVEFKGQKLVTGEVVRLDRVQFKADSPNLDSASFSALEEVYRFLANNPNVAVEVGGHTNNIPPDDYCDKLSGDRARTVTDYLISKGISPDRLQYKGYGKRKPIADNKTSQGLKLNQRVEVKILKVE
jgi:outer membrane protein OmpA-like peptidoglycan-associated protein